ncbi:signal peptidase I [Halosimplex aquaticum]|uniref:Signal peptidase I n=1 Tax=Halosimplex aquaticum TaxID=3026162 RepID=A0ABD5XWG1_9EURY|nr:signal peptidase I [Halosimplex aquaticum]
MRNRHLLVTAAVLLVVAPVLGHVAMSLAPGTASYVVSSDSMAPTFASGSLVYVGATGDYGAGDVITFRHGDRTVTHRVVEETDRGYVTRGDANDRLDDWRVEESQVVGEVLLSVPVYGALLAFAGTPLGYLLGVVLPASVLILVEVRALAGQL